MAGSEFGDETLAKMAGRLQADIDHRPDHAHAHAHAACIVRRMPTGITSTIDDDGNFDEASQK